MMPSANRVAPVVPISGRSAVAKSAPFANCEMSTFAANSVALATNVGDRGNRGDPRADRRVDAPLRQVRARQPLVDDRALLEEDHPRRHRRPDVREDQA